MISFLTSPKAFTGHFARIQRKAIQSWLNVHPAAEVLLYGNAAGAAEIAAELSRVVHVPVIPTSARGVPLFDAITAHAQDNARHEMQAYVNCDILFPPDFLTRIAPVRLERFLVVGQRLNLTAGVDFDLATGDWLASVQALYRENRMALYPASGMDYFVFPRGLWRDLAPLIIGRGGYDGALVAYCLRRSIPVIDATLDLPVLHQYHDYSHLTGGFEEAHSGREAMQNYQVHDVLRSTPNTMDADYRLKRGTVELWKCRGDALRTFELRLRYKHGLKILSLGVRLLWRLRRAARLARSRALVLDNIVQHYPRTK